MVNRLKFILLFTTVYFNSQLLFSQEYGREAVLYGKCEIKPNQIIDDKLLSLKTIVNPKDISLNTEVKFNEAWLEKARIPGAFCRQQFLRDITKEDLRKNSNLRREIEASGKEVKINLDQDQFYQSGKLYAYVEEKTNYRNWMTVKPSDYSNEDFYKLVMFSQCPNLLPEKFQTVDLSKINGANLYLRSFSQDIAVFVIKDRFAIKDSLYLGGMYGVYENLKETPMLKRADLEQKKTVSLDSALKGKKIVMENFDLLDFSQKSYPFYKMNRIKFREDAPMLLVERFNEKGEKDLDGFIGIDLTNPDSKIYECECFDKIWKEEKSKLEEEARSYDKYLRENKFTEQEIKHIKANTVFIGMREKALYASLGPPIKTNTTVIKNLESKQCVYGDGIFVYVENGKVTGYQNLESLRE